MRIVIDPFEPHEKRLRFIADQGNDVPGIVEHIDGIEFSQINSRFDVKATLYVTMPIDIRCKEIDQEITDKLFIEWFQREYEPFRNKDNNNLIDEHSLHMHIGWNACLEFIKERLCGDLNDNNPHAESADNNR